MMKIEVCRWYQWRHQVYNSKDKIKHIHQNQNVRCAYQYEHKGCTLYKKGLKYIHSDHEHDWATMKF